MLLTWYWVLICDSWAAGLIMIVFLSYEALFLWQELWVTARACAVCHRSCLIRGHSTLCELLKRHFAHELIKIEATGSYGRWHALLSIAGVTQRNHTARGSMDLIPGQGNVSSASVSYNLERSIGRHCLACWAACWLKTFYLQLLIMVIVLLSFSTSTFPAKWFARLLIATGLMTLPLHRCSRCSTFR